MNRVYLTVLLLCVVLSGCNGSENRGSDPDTSITKTIISEDPPCSVSWGRIDKKKLQGVPNSFLLLKTHLVMAVEKCVSYRHYDDGTSEVIDGGYKKLVAVPRPTHSARIVELEGGRTIVRVQITIPTVDNSAIDRLEIRDVFGTADPLTFDSVTIGTDSRIVDTKSDVSREEMLKFHDFPRSFHEDTQTIELDITSDPNFFKNEHNAGYTVLWLSPRIQGNLSLLSEPLALENN